MIQLEPLRAALRQLASDAKVYFAEAATHAKWKEDDSPFGDIFTGPSSLEGDYYWSQLPLGLQEKASTLIERLLPQCAELAELARTSALTGSEDTHDVKLAAKSMRAALRLRNYTYHRPDVLHDEGHVLGFQPAQQSETFNLAPDKAESEFFDRLASLSAVLNLVESAPNTSSAKDAAIDVARYRAGTAFIMMWMDPTHPELADVADAVRSVFRTFDVRAVRADDIEHEGLITEKVINEIRTAEFLFADLSGTRPNVYYEIGYAHALGKRVILFRKTGTGVHFDLAGYNCPEYENLLDLREKLTRRLISITNRNPAAPKEI